MSKNPSPRADGLAEMRQRNWQREQDRQKAERQQARTLSIDATVHGSDLGKPKKPNKKPKAKTSK